MEERKIRVVIKEVDKPCEVKEIPYGYKSFQQYVQGLYEIVEMPNHKNIDIACNEEYLLNGMKANLVLPEHDNVLGGPLIFIGYEPKEGDSISLTDKQIEEVKEFGPYSRSAEYIHCRSLLRNESRAKNDERNGSGIMRATYNGLTVEVDYDTLDESPREYSEPISKMVCWHRKYRLGDQHEFETPQDFKESEEYKNAFALLPLYLYDHSGLAMSTESFVGRAAHEEWDSGQVGYIYIPKSDVEKKTGLLPLEENTEALKEMLKDEVEQYSQYLEGNVFMFSITDKDGEEIAGGNGYMADTMESAVQQMKESCLEYESLFEKLQKQFDRQYVAG